MTVPPMDLRDRLDRLPPLVRPGLKVIFVGTRPGSESLRTGWYYADPSNAFYASLHAAGLTPRQVPPSEFRSLLEYGIGLDDVYDDPTRLRRRLIEAAPLAVCFNSKEALEKFAPQTSGDWRGAAAGKHASIEDVRTVWAVPDSSGTAVRYRAERVALLRQLAARWTR